MIDTTRKKTVFFFFTIVISGLSADAVEIQLLSRSSTTNNVVTLADVATLKGANAAVLDQFGRVELFPVPPAGRYRVLRRREIRELLRLHGFESSQIRFSGSTSTHITASAPKPAAARTLVRPTTHSGPQPDESVSIVVAARHIEKGHILRIADVKLMTVPRRAVVLRRSRSLVKDLNSVVGLEATRAIETDGPLDAAQLRKPILIRRNEIVRVTARGSGVRVSTNAKAMEEGAINDVVTLQTLESRKRLVARVTGILTAEVYAGSATAADNRPSQVPGVAKQN